MMILAAALAGQAVPPRMVHYDYEFACKLYSSEGRRSQLSGRLVYANPSISNVTMRIDGAGYPMPEAGAQANMNGAAEAYVRVEKHGVAYLYALHLSANRGPNNGYVTVSRGTPGHLPFAYVATGSCDMIPQEAAVK